MNLINPLPARSPQVNGHFSPWRQRLDSDQDLPSRRFHQPLPLGTPATL